MTVGEVLDLIAIIIIPIIAIFLGRWLQDRAEKRRDKMQLFQSVMTFRYGWSAEGVRALNNIHVVFVDDKEVRQCWRNYFKHLCLQAPTEEELQQGQ